MSNESADPGDLGWFKPEPKQLAFLSCWDRDSCYAGGVGAGKTLSGGFKALMAALQWPGSKGLVARQTYRALEDTTKRVILDGDDKPPIIAPQLIAKRSNDENTVVLVNGSEILFRSFQDFNMDKIKSLNLSWLYLDEATEATEKVWLSFVDRLRHPLGPRIAWGTTNPNGHDWVWRKFHPDANAGQIDSGVAGERPPVLFVAKSTDNPHLAPDYIARLRKMPKEWQRRYVDASFDTAAGQIWDEYDRHAHVVPPFEIPYNWRPVDALDHGRRNPTAYLQARVDFDGNILITDGYYEPGLVSQHAAAIKMLRAGHNDYGPIVADPACWNKGTTGKSVADMYYEAGLALRQGANDVDAGLLRVSEWFVRLPDVLFPDWHQWAGTLGPDGLGSPRLFILDTLGTAALRNEIPDYRWRDLSPAQERDRDQPEEPRKKDDHAVDALRYLMMSQPRPGVEFKPLPDDTPRPERSRMVSAGIQSMRF